MATVTFTGTTSSAFDLTIYGETGRQRINSLVFPASWLSATVTVQSSSDLGNTYQTVYLPGGTAYSFTAAPSSEVTLDIGIFSDLTNVKFVSSVSQTASPAVTVILVDADHASSLGGELSSGGGGGGSSASVGTVGSTVPGSADQIGFQNASGNLTNVSSGNPLPVTSSVPSGNGSDASNSKPAALTVLQTFTVTNPGQYYVQNQSAATLQVIFNYGGTTSIQLLAPGSGANNQGGDTAPALPFYTGTIAVAGASGAQFLAIHN